MALFKNPPQPDRQPSELDIEVAKAFEKMGTREEGALVEAGLAKETLIALMFRHANLLSEEQKAEESATLYELALHLSGYDADAIAGGKNEEDLRALGTTLMTAGRVQLATQIFEQLVTCNDSDEDDHIRLASLYYALNRKQDARQFLTRYFRENPMSFHAADRPGGAIGSLLRVSGYDKTEYKMSQRSDGSFRYYRSGGHFMLRYLLDSENYDVHSYTIADNNIDVAPPDVEYDLLLNTIADADTEYRSLTSLAAFVGQHPGLPIVNHPARVLATTRDNNYRVLNSIPGIRFPKTQRFSLGDAGPASLAAHIESEDFSYPFIIRQTGTHTAVSTSLVEDRTDLESYLAGATGADVYAIEFVQNASDAGHYTKMRFFAIDGALYPIVHHMDQVWNVHGGNRKTFMASHEWMVDREKQFMADPASVIGEEAYRLLGTLPNIIKLDFFGFDFTLLKDGTVLIFELNPAMRHSYTHAENFPYLRPHLEAASEAFKKMITQRARAI